MGNILKIALAAIAAAFTWLFGGWSMLLIVACVMMLIDYITGVIAAAINRELSSKVGWKGILKKLSMLCIIAIAALFDRLFPNETIICQSVACLYYIGNEGVSIIENAGRAGVPIPDKIKKLFETLKEDNDDEEDSK